MNNIDSDCVLEELVKSFGREYFHGRLKWYYDHLRERVNSEYRSLTCSSIDELKDERIKNLFKNLWAHSSWQGSREGRKFTNIQDLRSILKVLLCEDTIYKKKYIELLREIRRRDVGLATLSEIATLLHPTMFFIINSRLTDAVSYLIREDVLPRSRYEPYVNKNNHELLKKYVDGREISVEESRTINEFLEILQEIVNRVLEYLREVNSEADYIDADAFMFFVSVVYNLKTGKRVHINTRKNFINPMRDQFGENPDIVFDKMLKLAKRTCMMDGCLNLDETDRKILDMASSVLLEKKQLVLYGVPGTGKTFMAKCIAEKIAGFRKRISFITFHPSYSYEDFIEGIRPVLDNTSRELRFNIQNGLFKEIVAKATCDLIYTILSEIGDKNNISGLDRCEGEQTDKVLDEAMFIKSKLELQGLSKRKIKETLSKAPKYVLVIDEINRGDMAKIFGELITLLESDKRLFEDNEIIVRLPYSKQYFFIPPNLFIIGTMNSADRSIAFVDYALRRRFTFIELEPDYKKIPEKVNEFPLREFFILLNKYLSDSIDRDHRIGHSYLMNIKNLEELRKAWFTQIRPLLIEFFYGKDDEIKEVFKELYTESFIDKEEEFEKALENALQTLRKVAS